MLYAALVVLIFTVARSVNLNSHLDWRLSAFSCFVLAMLPAYGLHRALRSVLTLGLSPHFLWRSTAPASPSAPSGASSGCRPISPTPTGPTW